MKPRPPRAEYTGPAPRYKPGDRVTWTLTYTRKGTRYIKTYPATVQSEAWYARRTREPWWYRILLDRTPQTKRMTWLERYPTEDSLTPLPEPNRDL